MNIVDASDVFEIKKPIISHKIDCFFCEQIVK